jgi:hypothetical protein
MLWDDLPSGESIPVLSLLAGLALFALWQWSDADRLRARLRSLEEELREEDVEYERSGDDAVED